MQFIADLWWPILLSAVLVFVASSLLHMVIPIHKADYKKLPGEEKVLESMRSAGVQPGTYMFPNAGSMKEMGTPEMLKKFEQGPVGHVTVLPSGPPAMGKNLVLWFIYSMLIGLFVAYVASVALAPGAEYLTIFRVTGATAMLAYAITAFQDSIWKGQSWSTTGKFVFDGVIYTLVTAGCFAGFWPNAV